MSWIATAVIGSAVVGAVASGSAAGKAADVARDASEAELAFARERYQDFRDTYGELESNLAEYYENLTPELLEVQGLEAFEKEREAALTNAREVLAQRGISTSGLAGRVELESELRGAEERARIRAETPLRSAQERSRFLQIGLGQDPAGDVQSALSGAARSAEARSAQAAGLAGQAIGSAAGTVGDYFLSDAFANRGATASAAAASAGG